MEAEQEQGPSVACCEQPDAQTQQPCALCGRPTCQHCRCQVNEHRVCRACQEGVRAELEREGAHGRGVPMAILGGLLGSLLGGIAWAAISAATNMEIGYVALGVGWLAGQGVFLGAGRRRGRDLQVVTVACSILGLVVGRYFSLAHVMVSAAQSKGVDFSYLDPEIARIFAQHTSDFLSPWDALWGLLAVGVAWRMLKPSQVHLS